MVPAKPKVQGQKTAKKTVRLEASIFGGNGISPEKNWGGGQGNKGNPAGTKDT